MEPSSRKRRVDQITNDGDGERVYRFMILLPNGTSVGITLRDPSSGMPIRDLITRIKQRYLRAQAQDPSLRLKGPIAWESDGLCLENANGEKISRIIFDRFRPNKRHLLNLHDGSGDRTDTFENMWDLTPDTDLLKELPEDYSFETALADLIDNSLQAVWANPPNSKRFISLDISDEKISIFDTGPGMDDSDDKSITKWGKMGASLHRKFKAKAVGGKPPYLMPFFGLFGYGGPIASMHLGRHAVVSSKTMNSKKVYMLHLEREALLRRSGSQRSWRTPGGVRDPSENESARAPRGSFTKVEIFQPRMKKVNLYRLQCKLKDIYFPYVQCDGLSNLRRTTRPVYFEAVFYILNIGIEKVNGSDLAGIEGGEVAITNLHSCNGPDFEIEVHFSITQHTDANRVLGPTAIHEANARLKCVYFPVVQGKENIEKILEKLEADGCRVAETYESFRRVSIRRLGRLLPDARWGLLPFMEERHKKGDKAHLFRRSFFRVKCFIDTDAGFSPTPAKTDLAQHNPFTCALQKIGRPLDGVKEIEVKIYREGKLLTPLQLEKEYCDWVIQMHERYDEEVDSGEDKAVFIINPGNKKALGVSSDVVRVHRWIKRKGVSWRCGQKIKIPRGACAGVRNNVYATLEYFLLEGLQGDGGGEARIICRPLGVPDDKGCILNKHDGDVSLELQSSLSIPIGVIDSRELVTVRKLEWERHLEKHRLKAPSSIDLLDASQCEELGVHAALPGHAPIPAGQDPPKEIIAVIRPANFSYSTTPKKLNQKYIVKNRMEMSMEVKFSGHSDNGQESHLYSSRVTPSSHRGFHGLYIFSLQHKSHELFQKSGIYKFLFHTDETSCKECEKVVTVHASVEVGRRQLLGYDQNKHLRARVGSCFPPLATACYDRYGNPIPFPSTPKVNLQFKTGEGPLICAKNMKTSLLADRKSLRIKVYHLKRRVARMRQAGGSIEAYYNNLQGLWREIDFHRPNPMRCPEDIERYNMTIQEDQVYTFLDGLDDHLDKVRANVLQMQPFPTVEQAYALVRREAVRAKWEGLVLKKETAVNSRLGPMNTQLKQRKVTVHTTHTRHTRPTESARPEEIDDDGVEGKTDTEKNMSTMFEILRRKKRVGLDSLILNRQSFAQTVENLSALSFLVKDGRAEIIVDEKGNHFVSPKNAPDYSLVLSGEVASSHFVFRFDYRDWKMMIGTVPHGEELMPHRVQPFCLTASQADPMSFDSQSALPIAPIRELTRNCGIVIQEERVIENSLVIHNDSSTRANLIRKGKWKLP